MHIPKTFKETNFENIKKIVDNYPFATLISCSNNTPVISHLPALLETRTPGKAWNGNGDCECVFSGHLARFNTHCDYLRESPQATLVFNGPNGYISPTWYAEKQLVPTWNYVSIHFHGIVTISDEHEDIKRVVNDLSEYFETSHGTGWQNTLDAGALDELYRHVSSITFTAERVEAQFKMSQNRSDESLRSLINHFRQMPDATYHAMADLMASELEQR